MRMIEGKEQIALATVVHALALAVFYEPWDYNKSPLALSVLVIDTKYPDNLAEAPRPSRPWIRTSPP
jgi:hypothetical protein